jgi:hypothetical protein
MGWRTVCSERTAWGVGLGVRDIPKHESQGFHDIGIGVGGGFLAFWTGADAGARLVKGSR